MTQKTSHAPSISGCDQQRLAETPLGAVDACDCGMMQLHVGALTLRLTPEAVSELSALLSRALVAHAGIRPGSVQASEVLGASGAVRGQA